MPMRPILAPLAVALVVAGCMAPALPPTDPELPVSEGDSLVRSLQVDTRWSGEPSILVLQDGTLLITGAGGMTRYAENPLDAPGNAGQSYIWRSTDSGANWTFVDMALQDPLNPLLPYRSGVFGVEGDLATDGGGRAYFVDLTMLATHGIAVSLDHGETWMNAGAPMAGLLPGTDRPWIAAHSARPDSQSASVVVKYLQLAGAHRLAYFVSAPDGALLMVEDRELPPCGQTPIAIERTGDGPTEARVVMACIDSDALSVVRAPAYFGPAGLDFPAERLPGPPGKPAGGIGAVLAAGDSGAPMAGVYALAWNDVASGHAIHLSVSMDAGATWSEPLRLNGDNTTAVFPWVDISGAGNLAVTWYESPGVGDPNTLDGTWVPMHASLLLAPDGRLAGPNLLPLSDHPVHTGPICTQGLNCVLEDRARERRLLDFFEVDVDDDGTSHVTWTDNSQDVPTIWYGQVQPGRKADMVA